MEKLLLALDHPAVSHIHSTGMAGLYMALKTLDTCKQNLIIPGGLQWVLTPHSIEFTWQPGMAYCVFDWLFQHIFKLEPIGDHQNAGVINFVGRPYQSPVDQILTHYICLKTFYQHTSTKTIVAKTNCKLPVNTKNIQLETQVLGNYIPQNFAQHFWTVDGELKNNFVQLKSSLKPGAKVKHINIAETAVHEPVELVFSLLFAPIAAGYGILAPEFNNFSRFGLVFPLVDNLETYYNFSQTWHHEYSDFFYASTYDLGATYLARSHLKEVKVTEFVIQKWAKQQYTRNHVVTLSLQQKDKMLYGKVCEIFPSKILTSRDKQEVFVAVSPLRDLIAQNLCYNQPWYTRIVEMLRDDQKLQDLLYLREELSKMVDIEQHTNNDISWLFLKTCHEAIYYSYGKAASKASRGNSLVNFQRAKTKILNSVRRSRNYVTFRKFLSEFFSNAGSLPTFREHQKEILYFISQPENWEICRDLLLLAFASYKTAHVRSTDADSESDTVTDNSDSDFDVIQFDADTNLHNPE